MMLTRMLDAFEGLVNAVFLALRPEAGGGGGGDGDAALALLLHPVGHGGAFMHLADLVDHAGVEEDALGERRLAGVDVRGDADVARPLQRKRAVRRIRILRRRLTLRCAAVASLPYDD